MPSSFAPCVITLSHCAANRFTSRSKGYPFEVALPQDLPVAGVVLADLMRSVDWHSRRAEWICALSEDATLDALERLGALLDPAQG